MTRESLAQFDSVKRTVIRTEEFCRFREDHVDTASRDLHAGQVAFDHYRYIPDVAVCLPRFLHHALQTMLVNAPRTQSVYCDILKRNIALPSIADQEKIARILDAAETVCKLRERSFDLFAKLTESAFLDMFGSPSKENERWPLKSLGELASLKIPMSRYDIKVKDSSLPLVRGSNLRDIWVSDAQIDRSGTDDLIRNAEIVPEGSVLCLRFAGEIFCASILETPSIVDASCVVIRPSEGCTPEYLCLSMRLSGDILLRYSSGATLAQLTPSLMRSHVLPVPPLDLQRRYVDLLRAIREQKNNVTALRQRSEELYKNLLDRLIGKPNRELHHAD